MKVQKKKGTSLFWKIFFPMIFLTLIQITCIVVVISSGGVLKQLNQNEIDILKGQVINRADFLESEMTNHWSDMDLTVESLNETANNLEKSRKTDFAHISNEGSGYEVFLEESVDDLIEMLRRNNVNGAYIILNSDNLSGESKLEAMNGICIRDLDSASQSTKENTDLLFKVAPSSIVENLKIATESDWTTKFHFEEESRKTKSEEDLKSVYDYFINPYNTASENDQLDYETCGYWSNLHMLPGSEREVISYSVPLRTEDGVLYGVLGVEVTLDYIKELLPYSELNVGQNGGYLLGVSSQDFDKSHNQSTVSLKDGSPTKILLNPVALNDGNNFVKMEEEIKGSGQLTFDALSSYEDVFSWKGLNVKEDSVLSCAHLLKLYTSNGPFSKDTWILAGLAGKEDLFGFVSQIQYAFVIALLISIFVSLAGACYIGFAISKPIKKLAKSVEKSYPQNLMEFEKVNIQEIDGLAEAISDSRQKVFSSNSKFTEILKMASTKLGGFEVDSTKEYLFVTENFFDVFGSKYINTKGLTVLGFEKYMQGFESNVVDRTLGDKGIEISLYKIPLDDHEIWVRLKHIRNGSMWIGLAEDVTKETFEMKKVEHERDYDVLTDLLNRRGILRALNKMFSSKSDSLKIAALIMLDLDNLKYINDTYGHDIGDDYIQCAAECFKGALPTHSFAARRSGDEFIIFIYGYDSKESARLDIQKIWEDVDKKSIQLPDGSNYRLRMSAGIAWYPEDSTMFSNLIRYADFSMYKIKHSKKGNICEFDLDTYKKESYLLQGKEELNIILDFQKVEYHMQPIVSAYTGEIFAFEALMRTSTDTFFSPNEVLLLATREFKLDKVERMTWLKGLEAFVELVNKDKLGENTKLFLNSIPNQHLSEKDIKIIEFLYGPYLNRVVQELTEETKFHEKDMEMKRRFLNKWNIDIALDDYGSGYNGDTTLISSSPRYVKLDMGLIRNIDTDKNKQEIVKSTIKYAKGENIIVVAEGVETYFELDKVIELGADLIQGFYFGKPSNEHFFISDQKALNVKKLHEKHFGADWKLDENTKFILDVMKRGVDKQN